MISNKNLWRTVSPKQIAAVDMPSPLTYRLTKLKPDATYRLELRAKNRLGLSDPTQVIIRTAKGGCGTGDWGWVLGGSLVECWALAVGLGYSLRSFLFFKVSPLESMR